MPKLDPHKQAQYDVIRAKQLMIRCEYCQHFHELEYCLEFRMLSHTAKREFCQGKGICIICLRYHGFNGCPDRGLRVCGHRGCNALTHHQLLHCEHRGPIPSEMWTVTAPEEPVTHVNEAGASVAGPSEVGLIQSLNDSGLMDSDEEERSSNEIAGDPEMREVNLSEQAKARAENL